MEPLEAMTSALGGVFEFRKEFSQMQLLSPLPLHSNERQERLAFADEQEAEAAQLLLRVHELRKSALLAKASYAAVRVLPPEILSHIFVLALPELFEFKGKQLPYFSVLEVNRWWRSISLSTSELWARIYIYFGPSSGYSAKSVANLATWLERAKNSQLEVQIYGWAGHQHSQMQETLWNMIFRHINHCSKLIHHSAPSITTRHMTMLCNYGHICQDMFSLELSTSHSDLDGMPPLVSPLLPRLRHLRLLGNFPRWNIQFNAPRLEKLLLGNIHIHCQIFCDVLNRYPSIVKLELIGVEITVSEDRNRQLCNLNIQELTLALFTSTKQFWICIMPCLPSVQTLIIREYCYTAYDSMPVMPSVQRLCFDLSRAKRLCRDHQYRDFLKRTPNIREVSIDARELGDLDMSEIRYSDPIIKELFVYGQDISSVVCPQIRHVGIYSARSSQKRVLRLSRSRTAFLLQFAEKDRTGGASLMQPFTVTTHRCLALADMTSLALPELEMTCKQFPKEKWKRHDLEDPIFECLEDCECFCEDADCDCCDHGYPPSDSDDDP